MRKQGNLLSCKFRRLEIYQTKRPQANTKKNATREEIKDSGTKKKNQNGSGTLFNVEISVVTKQEKDTPKSCYCTGP